jgi:hypothetical protein
VSGRSLDRAPGAGRWVFFLGVIGGVTISHWVWSDGRGCDEVGPLVERFRCPCGWQVEGSYEYCSHDHREHLAAGCPRLPGGARSGAS